MIELLHMDCMEYMAGLPDKAFDLAIVDPPYGIGEANGKNATRISQKGGKGHYVRDYGKKTWDSATPKADYFTELRRVSRNQVVWGANYMTDNIPPSGGWIFWDKERQECDFSDGEFAYTSFRVGGKLFRYCWDGFRQGPRRQSIEKRTHPTQKPVALYRWLLQNYAKPGQRILDTHGGSMSIAIACDIEGFDLTLCEIDKDYFEAGKKRLADHQAQPRLFDEQPRQDAEQLKLA